MIALRRQFPMYAADDSVVERLREDKGEKISAIFFHTTITILSFFPVPLLSGSTTNSSTRKSDPRQDTTSSKKNKSKSTKSTINSTEEPEFS